MSLGRIPIREFRQFESLPVDQGKMLSLYAPSACAKRFVVGGGSQVVRRRTIISKKQSRVAPASWTNTLKRANFSVMASGKIELYSLGTPNGMKVGVALEEMGVEYNPHTINIMRGDQFTPEFIKVNPNSKIPAITDPNGPDGKPIHVFESGAILIYLAEKTGKFLPKEPREKYEVIQWLFFQMAGVGPMFGQFGHFYKYAKEKCKDPYPLERYSNEAKRLLGVLEKRLEGRQFLVNEEYTIADMATFPWVHCLDFGYNASEYLGLSNFPNVVAWKERCMARPATAKGLKVCSI